ncbi:MAG: imidazole glycerol phosphate synthase subunit HisF [Armatimonadetes bacterium]|nr:imidazole glycerol phosphate synthase subunit HisF [Armatimonadota bacterium]NIM24317.1 imidazole glycerol phosphate synthase subunit HisF [Armatimonadota bacterium]NIM68186.1 imidazole glycerol phosphate synthase subunit HisF [Armatimonadota bacterium]NIM76646.1 imidazole glycerol phosphate synthase subunit HisF [Armatimonadota bacterium]NIN06391.1 imidazole glycerol phosphate synthase subunit HisF [Armatimonadota bacterium]
MNLIRVIPCLDMKDGRVVKGVHFVDLRDAADPVQAARAYASGGADEIAFLDITATVEKRRTMFDVLEKVAAVVDVPLTVGGGIKSAEDIEQALKSGADRVSISSAAYRNPDMVKEAVANFGSDKIIVAIDADANDACPSKREVYIDGGRTATGKDAVEFAKEMAAIGVGQILPTSKATDGTTEGYDIQLTREIADATGLPVIASGGAGKLEHFYEAVTDGHAQAVLAASVFHFGTFTIRQVKEYMQQRGLPVSL